MDLSPLKSAMDGKREGEDRVESVGKPKSQLRDKGRERIKRSRNLLLWEGK